MSKHLAIDIGASSGKAVVGGFGPDGFEPEGRFDFGNSPGEYDGCLRWDIRSIAENIRDSLKDARVHQIDSVGIDTWGVDFGLLDSQGELVQFPLAYRDPIVSSTVDKVFSIIPKEELFERTGIQHLPFNTIFQLHSLSKNAPDVLEKADKMLLMPGLLTHFIGGDTAVDATIASTTQLIDIKTGGWAYDIIEKLGLPPAIFPEIVPPGTVAGQLSGPVGEGVGCTCPVIHTAGHDTAAAVASFDLGKNGVYISSGSWFLVGCVSGTPLVNMHAYSVGLTNERAADGRFRILKNVTGLYLLQECERTWFRESGEWHTAELVEYAGQVEPFGPLINPDDPAFATPGDMPSKINRSLETSRQRVLENRGKLVRCILESIAVKCSIVLDGICNAVKISPTLLQIGGGGARNELLCRMIAGATGLKTVAGPYEATAIGNIIVQAESSHTIPSLKEGARIVAESMHMKTFNPSDIDDWKNMKQKYLNLFEK